MEKIKDLSCYFCFIFIPIKQTFFIVASICFDYQISGIILYKQINYKRSMKILYNFKGDLNH